MGVVDLWLQCRMRGGPDTPLLPQAGGMLDQPAALIDAFDMLDRWHGKAKDEA
jgi:hypothetical protein